MSVNSARGKASPRIAGLMIGAVSIVGGGLVAAVASPLQLEKGSWLAAYLVLITGVAQLVLAQQQHLLHPNQNQRRSEWFTLWFWIIGNTAVIVGSLQSAPLVVDAGGVLLIIAVLLAWIRTRGTQNKILGIALRIIYFIVIVSVPVGLLLAHLRA